MTTILHVSCSPRGKAAESYRLAREVIDRLRRVYPEAVVVDRVIGGGELPPIDDDYALSQQSTEDVSSAGTMAQSEVLVQELERANFVVIGTPIHNLTVPAALKVWIDHVVRARRTFNTTPAGKIGTLADRPVFIAIASGGRISGTLARQPDFLTPYLRAILEMIGLHDLTFFSVQGTAAGPEAAAGARVLADEAMDTHFSRR